MPTSYRGKTLRWNSLNQLMSVDGTTTAFGYDGSGRRVKKGDIIFTYDFSGRLVKSNGFEFYYDGSGLSGFKYNNQKYIYHKNLQGDITQILDNSGNTVVKYSYDAWGNHTTTDTSGLNLGNLNPFRYRSYYYDTETGLYYLQTRYYDPETGRFISQDDVSYLDSENVNGLNLYAYCGNNPVMMVDPLGNSPKWWEWLINGIVIAAGVVACCIPGLQGVGVGLLVAGGSMLASNIMSAAGVDGKTASIISSALSIVAGIALCFTPFAGIGASMIGSGVGGLAGGYISEALGGSFTTGAMIGNIVGGIAGGQVYKGISAVATSSVSNASKITLNHSTSKQVGNYLLRDAQRQVRYVGVGSKARMAQSLAERSKIVSGLTAEFRPAPNRIMALAREAALILEYGGAQSVNPLTNLLNKINSPGLRHLFEWF